MFKRHADLKEFEIVDWGTVWEKVFISENSGVMSEKILKNFEPEHPKSHFYVVRMEK